MAVKKAKTRSKRIYEVQAEDGVYLAADYTYRGIEYRQMELDVPRLLEVTSVLEAVGLDGILDLSDVPRIQFGTLLANIAKNRAHDKLLRALLRRKDGGEMPPDTFMKGRAFELWKLAEAVLEDFFTINAELTSGIVDFLLQKFARGLERVGEISDRLISFISSQAAKSHKKKP